MAQQGLKINRLFDGHFKNSPNVTEIIVTGKKAGELGLSVYHSLATTDQDKGELIESLVVKDGAHAVEKDVEYRNGQLYYGFYTLRAPTKKRDGQYLFFLNQRLARKSPKNVVTLIYMEGKGDSEQIKKLIRK